MYLFCFWLEEAEGVYIFQSHKSGSLRERDTAQSSIYPGFIFARYASYGHYKPSAIERESCD